MDLQGWDFLCQPPCTKQIFFCSLVAKEIYSLAHAYILVINEGVGK